LIALRIHSEQSIFEKSKKMINFIRQINKFY